MPGFNLKRTGSGNQLTEQQSAVVELLQSGWTVRRTGTDYWRPTFLVYHTARATIEVRIPYPTVNALKNKSVIKEISRDSKGEMTYALTSTA